MAGAGIDSALWTELDPEREHALGLPGGRTLSYVALGAEKGPRAPTALWVGEGDVTHPPVMARKLAARLAGGPEVHVVPDAATFGMRVVFEDVLRFCAPAA